jgi:hypothetical protein
MDTCLISVDGDPLSTAEYKVHVHTSRIPNLLLHVVKFYINKAAEENEIH